VQGREEVSRFNFLGGEKIRYSQKYVDVLNLKSREIETIHFVDLANYLLEQQCDFPFRDFISGFGRSGYYSIAAVS
jgi:hypothetical protein